MSERVIHCPAGTIRGRSDGGVARFPGIPFAEAPVGSLRFQATERRGSFIEPFDAFDLGATPQRGRPYPRTVIPEPSIPGDDILSLNIWAPERAAGSDVPLPVLVWIHGGGYLAGSPASPWYEGSAIARGGVVFVSVSYRLGVEGFGLIDGGANRALLDWVTALEWVRDNIGAFGGDAGRVTVGGQSAGGGAVLTLLGTPSARPLFSRAFAMSPIDASLSADLAAGIAGTLASDLGIPPTSAGFATVEPEALQGAAIALAQSGGEATMLPFAPVHGVDPLPMDVRRALHTHGRDKPLLIGSTSDEFDSPRVQQVSPSGRVTDWLFRAVVPRTARARASGSAATWLYSFEWVSPVFGGAAHCTDIPYFLGTTARAEAALGPDVPDSLARTMHADLVAFVHGEELPWPPGAGRQGDAVRVYGSPASDTGSSIVAGGYDDVLPLIDMPWEGPA